MCVPIVYVKFYRGWNFEGIFEHWWHLQVPVTLKNLRSFKCVFPLNGSVNCLKSPLNNYLAVFAGIWFSSRQLGCTNKRGGGFSSSVLKSLMSSYWFGWVGPLLSYRSCWLIPPSKMSVNEWSSSYSFKLLILTELCVFFFFNSWFRPTPYSLHPLWSYLTMLSSDKQQFLSFNFPPIPVGMN